MVGLDWVSHNCDPILEFIVKIVILSCYMFKIQPTQGRRLEVRYGNGGGLQSNRN